MYNQKVSKRTQELIEEYGQLLGNSSWKESLSIQEFLEIRKFAADELKNRIFDIDDKNNKIDNRKSQNIPISEIEKTIYEEKISTASKTKEIDNQKKTISFHNTIIEEKNKKKNVEEKKEEKQTKDSLKIEHSLNQQTKIENTNQVNQIEETKENNNEKISPSPIPNFNGSNMTDKEKRELALFNRLLD